MNVKRLLLSLLPLSISIFPSIAQTHPPAHAGEIKQAIKKLNTLGSVLYLAAHPDDENTRLIAWLAKEKLYRTGYLSLTRGDGGQNLIGTEQAEVLGLIRTNELLAARNVDGGEQFFSRAIDFGFSKTWEETFRIWGREQILADAVWVIRKFRPDVIITRFPPDERAGHGHHQASALLAIEAFRAAADPQRFPEQLKTIPVWQAKRLLWNTSSFFQGSPPSSAHFFINVGDYNPFVGQSYGEIAAESRSKHKSQGFGSPRQRGNSVERFEVLQGDAPEHTLFDGIETSWKRVGASDEIPRMIDELYHAFDGEHPEKSIPGLIALLDEVEQINDTYWKAQKTAEIKELVLACGGIWMESTAPAPKYAVGEQIPVSTAYIVRRPGVKVMVSDTILPFNEIHEETSAFNADLVTQPYWLRRPHALGSFVIDNPNDVGRPENSNAPKTSITLQINDRALTFERPIIYKYTDPVRGEVHEPLVIAPPITANLNQKALVFNGNAPKTLEVVFAAHGQQPVSATASLRLPEGWKAEPQQITLSFSAKSEETVSRFTIYPGERSSLTDSLSVVLQYDGAAGTAKALRSIAYEHIPRITWFPPSAARLSKIETGISASRIGYLPGAGDLIPNTLREIGLQVDILNEQDVLSGDLSQYDAIVTGVRLYNVNERVRYMQPRLLDYVKNGGTLLVQYNTSGGLKIPDLGPYPFALSRTRVTDEAAEVTFIETDNRILNYPNKITAADFDGWIQERGLYFVSDADPRYNQPLRMADPGETPNEGALLVTRYGKGNFVYTSLAFFRQLPAGVPGAYRLFVNLLAKPN
ncbi:N-acetylglucosaminyl deacetylase, LmbE family [Parapedobacter composti]|uniref:N-acetylglucosaminyl deacetylase, LmbE family n=1 Tax=Parapedobacter composti TaxID=623281 RepID=A0A1I1IX36_9SPHI|nr:PIG-L family deacetylase [Parapedobacter composti]SFC40909.1 N-acetylglucosaminyl deacetylase, LmbE family [Parapedobacter composti]